MKNTVNQSNIFFLSLLTLLTLMPVNAENGALQEQDFQPVETRTEFSGFDANFDFFAPAQAAASKKKSSSGNNLYSLKNEYFESIKVIIESKLATQEKPTELEIYLNGYEQVKDIAIPAGTKFKVKVYNLYDQYLGYIRINEEKPESNIRVSPFLLVPADFDKKNKKIVTEIKELQKAVDKPLLKDNIADGNGPIIGKQDVGLIATSSSPKDSKPQTAAPEPIVKPVAHETEEVKVEPIEQVQEPVDSKPRKIKIANISDSDIRISIQKPNGEQVGSGWTIGNDVYVPQYLNFQSEPINVEPLAKLIVSDPKTQKVFSKQARELNIDERGNYVWFIGSLSELENSANGQH